MEIDQTDRFSGFVFPGKLGLDFTPGRVYCLHIPHGCPTLTQNLEECIRDLAARDGKILEFCRWAANRNGFREWLRPQKSAEWLSDAAKISRADATRRIRGFGVPVADNLAFNAGTPRCLLGIAATLIRKPDVAFYSTDGIDPVGRRLVHALALSEGGASCLVHLESPMILGDGTLAARCCPRGAICLTLTFESA